MHYIWIMFTDMAVLQSMLGEIDPGFIVCHEWDLLGDEEQASRIAASIAPNDEIAGLIQYSLVHSAMRSADPVVADGDQGSPPSTREDLPFDGAEKLAARLQKKLDSFETRYCGPRRPSGRERW